MADRIIRPDECRLYYNASGLAGSDTSWTLIPNAQDIAITDPRDEMDATKRGDQWKKYELGHGDLSLTFTIMGAKDGSSGTVQTVLAALIAAHQAFPATRFGFAVKDGPIAEAGAQGYEFVGVVSGHDPDTPTDGDVVAHNFTVRPAALADDPVWRVTS